MGGMWKGSHMVAFRNCWVCVDTIVEVVTVGLDSGIVGRANGNSVEML